MVVEFRFQDCEMTFCAVMQESFLQKKNQSYFYEQKVALSFKPCMTCKRTRVVIRNSSVSQKNYGGFEVLARDCQTNK